MRIKTHNIPSISAYFIISISGLTLLERDDNTEMVVSTKPDTEFETLRKLSGKFSGISELLNRSEQERNRSNQSSNHNHGINPVETTKTTEGQTLPKSKIKSMGKNRKMKESPIYYFE